MRKNNAFRPKQKREPDLSSRFEAVCDVLSSAVDRWEVFGITVGEWSNIVFCYTILQNGPTGISKGEKLANVVKMLPKSGFKEKRKIPNRCFTAIWGSF